MRTGGCSASMYSMVLVHKQQVGFLQAGRDNRGTSSSFCHSPDEPGSSSLLFCSGVGSVALSTFTCAWNGWLDAKSVLVFCTFTQLKHSGG